MAPIPEDVVEHLITFLIPVESWSAIVDRYFIRVGKALSELVAWTPLTRAVVRRYQLLTEDEDDLLYFF